MYKIPALEEVAGVANLRSLISKIHLISPLMGILSLLARVRILLSSITEFMDSIQLASRSPSRMIHLGFSSSGSSAICLNSFENNPSFHSLEGCMMYP